jgi:phenylpropionate dioxygenase-like ring-hydroxylating dioxygenase large terminal subunit
MKFLRNAWYTAAWSHEVGRQLLARTYLNEPVVIYRKEDSLPVAMADRCPHRFAPLSLGRVVGDNVECGYHGLTFDGSGTCVRNPTQPGHLPRAAKVKIYPVVERYNMIWIWMGAPELADDSLIPDFFQYDHEDWSWSGDYLNVKANYLLVSDNLIDLSHAGFVHRGLLGDDNQASARGETTLRPSGLTENRMSENNPAVSAWKAAFDNYEGNVDYWFNTRWDAPGSMLLDVGVTPTGKHRDQGVYIFDVNNLTPETDRSTHYFYGHARSYRVGDAATTQFWREALAFAFDQDRLMLEAQQRNIGDVDLMQLKPVMNKGDRAAVAARRILDRMIELEQAGAAQEKQPLVDSAN